MDSKKMENLYNVKTSKKKAIITILLKVGL